MIINCLLNDSLFLDFKKALFCHYYLKNGDKKVR
jgi:hypothetical protein